MRAVQGADGNRDHADSRVGAAETTREVRIALDFDDPRDADDPLRHAAERSNGNEQHCREHRESRLRFCFPLQAMSQEEAPWIR